MGTSAPSPNHSQTLNILSQSVDNRSFNTLTCPSKKQTGDNPTSIYVLVIIILLSHGYSITMIVISTNQNV